MANMFHFTIASHMDRVLATRFHDAQNNSIFSLMGIYLLDSILCPVLRSYPFTDLTAHVAKTLHRPLSQW